MEIKRFDLSFSSQALEHIMYFKRLGNDSIKKKIDKLLEELQLHPFSGTGQVEMLKYDLAGFWSRRINKEHRIIYRVDEDKCIVYIYKMKGHY